MRLAALALAALVLAGCHTVTAGRVTAKRFDPDHVYHWTSCIMVGKVPVCSPHWQHYPDRCFVTLTDEEGSSEYLMDCATWPTTAVGDRMTVK